MINIAILLSGEGEYAERIIQHFEIFEDVSVALIVCDKEEQPADLRLRRYGVPSFITNRYIEIDKLLTEHKIDYIVLDEWSDKIPPNFSKKYRFKIIGLNHAIYPKGLNIYDDKIFEMVEKDPIIGFSIYLISNSDEYHILYTHKLKNMNWTTEEIKNKIKGLEFTFYPQIIENTIRVTNQYFKNES